MPNFLIFGYTYEHLKFHAQHEKSFITSGLGQNLWAYGKVCNDFASLKS